MNTARIFLQFLHDSHYRHYALKNLGLPEGNLALSHAIIYACEAEKSNSVYVAMGKANTDATMSADDKIPEYLKNYHYDEENPQQYKSSFYCCGYLFCNINFRQSQLHLRQDQECF